MSDVRFGDRIRGIIRSFVRLARSALQDIQLEIRSRKASIHPHPIFVLGNQKSGTSAIAVLLSEISGLSVTNDLVKEMKRPILDRVHRGEISFSTFLQKNRLDFSRDIVKEPSLTLFHDHLVEHFPESKSVFVIRDPRDNIRSILQRLKIPGDLPQLEERYCGEVTRAWALVLWGSWFGIQGENYIEMLAGRWNAMADVLLKNRDRMIYVRFEDFLENKLGVIDRLAKDLGIPRRYDISDKTDIQYQPPGDRSVKWVDFFGSENKQRIERVCRDWMLELGYEVGA